MNDTFSTRFKKMKHWRPPKQWLTITAIDAHAGGEPLRIITGGLPALKGGTVLERRRFMKEKFDRLRTALLWEPRGHADHYGAICMPPCAPENDFSVLFMHNEGYSTMCGHAIIALTKVVLETGMFEMNYPETMLKIEVPSGTITSYAHCENGTVKKVHFHNVPSFAPILNRTVSVPGIGPIVVDVSFGGAFYAYVDACECGVTMIPEEYRTLIERGMTIKRAVMDTCDIVHPFEKDLSFLYGTIFMGPGHREGVDSRNVCIFADGEVDRSPTGSGIAGRMALHYAKGEIKVGETMVIESLIGSSFTGSVHEVTQFGPYAAVIPRIEGDARIIGRMEFCIDPDDPFKDGFILR